LLPARCVGLIALVIGFGGSACREADGQSADGCGGPATLIHEIQGMGRSSPLLSPPPGEEQVVVEAVVVGSFPDLPGGRGKGLGGFFVQEEDDQVDDDPRTSEGLFVFDPSSEVSVAVGDRVRIRGRVAEYFGLTELVGIEEVLVCAMRGSASPAEVELPVDDEADWERWEGMRVSIGQSLVVTGHYKLGRFGEVDLAFGRRLEAPTGSALPGATALEVDANNRRRRILLDDGLRQSRPEPTPYLIRDDGASMRAGDTTGPIEGVLGFAFGRYRVQPTRPVHLVSGGGREEFPPEVEGRLRVVGWNVGNYMNGDGRGGAFPTRGPRSFDEFERQRAKLTETLVRLDPDIAALVEVENDGTGSDSAVGQLVEELNDRVPDARYALIEAEGIRSSRHGIAAAIVYRSESVVPIGPPAVLDAQARPDFDDRRNRPSLAQTFRVLATGQSLTVVVNHFKSKGSSCDSAGDPDEGDGQGDCNRTRTRAAHALGEWLADDPTGAMDTPALVLGDFNAYPFEDPVRTLELAGYVDLISRFEGPSAHTFVFDGRAGRLDHAMADARLLPFIGGARVWHTNADEPPVFDYRLENSPQNYRPDPFRASDHDPVLVGLFP